MGINEIISLAEKYGLKGGIIAFIIVVLYLLHKSGFFTKMMTKLSEFLIEKFINKNKKAMTNVSYSDVESHGVFNYIDFWMHSRIPTFQFSTEYRTVVFRKYLTLYLKVYKDSLQKFINTKSYVNMNDTELWKGFLTLTNDIVHDYEQEMRDSGIPQLIIDKMKSKNNDTISLTIDLIEGICNSDFYKSENNLLKVFSILNIMLSILENTIHNSVSVCNSINGQLKGLSFQDGQRVIKEP